MSGKPRTIIFANGWMGQPPQLEPAISSEDLIIAADGGALHCLELGLRPAVVIGDLDSVPAEALERLQAQGAEILRYPTRKDYTDLELALQYAREHGLRQVLLAAALGRRWDMTLANLLLPAALPEIEVRLVDGPQEIFLVRPGAEVEIAGRLGDTVSLIPLAGDTHGVTTRGLEYPLHAETLLFGGTRGVSNVLLGEPAGVQIETGMLICVVIHAPGELP
ncbi:MAG: thiamine diphosphokinase [Chloroflexota bacterium]